MGLFDIFNRLDTKNNNGLNLIHDKETKDLIFAFNRKNGRIDGLVQVFYSVNSSGHNPNYKLTNVGFVRQEYLFIDGFPNGYFKEFDSKGNLSYHIENIKSNSFNFSLNFSINFIKPNLLFSDRYLINGFVNEYYPNGILSKELKVVENKLNSSKSYYQNGQLNYDSIESKEYYDNGQLKKDLKSGEEYYENGQLKSDIKVGKEYYINGNIKIDNFRGKEYYILENLNPDIFNEIFSFKDILKTNFMISNKIINDYYSNITCYKYDGSLCNSEEIEGILLENEEEPHDSYQHSLGRDVAKLSVSKFRQTIKVKSIYSNPILINDFCFRFEEGIYGSIKYADDFGKLYYNNHKYTEFRLVSYTGWYNDIYYKDGMLSKISKNKNME